MGQHAGNTSDLNAAEYQRYARQIILPEVGIEGQQKLKQARILVVGSGGLGSPVTMYLAAAGVRTINLIDFDSVDVSNLHRQILFSDADVGSPKVEAASKRLQQINPHVQIQQINARLSADNAESIIANCDVVIDCTDNFDTRYLINDACVITGKPYIYAAIFQFEGYLTVFATPNGPCYRCVYGERPPAELVPNCAEGGVLGVLPGVLGTLQAVETIKLLLGIGESLVGRLVQYDALAARFREFDLQKDPHCPACAKGSKPSLTDQVASCTVTIAQSALTKPSQLRDLISHQAQFTLLDVRSEQEHSVSSIAGDMVIPLPELANRLQEIPRDKPVICYCLSGVRSQKAAELLRQHAFTSVSSLAGGILAWKSMAEGKDHE